MDESLKCNIATCRKPVSHDGKAVVTNCSHVFCVDCANSHACLTHGSPFPICPACEQALSEPDDVVCNSLNPSADYKSSVLSGLPPATVLEIATRALTFWSYQQQMEGNCQAMILKQSQEKVAIVERERDGMEHQAMTEMRDVENELNHERHKVHEASETHKVNRKQYEKLKAAYDKLRGKTAPNVGMASAPTPVPAIVEPFQKSTAAVRGAPAVRTSVGRTFGVSQSAQNGIQHHQPIGGGFATAAQMQMQSPHTMISPPHQHVGTSGLVGRGGASSASGSGGPFTPFANTDPSHVFNVSTRPPQQTFHRPTSRLAGPTPRDLANATPDLTRSGHRPPHQQQQHAPPTPVQASSRHRMSGTPRPGTALAFPQANPRLKGFRPSTASGLP